MNKKLEGFSQSELREVRIDMMRYKNNSLSFWLSILAIVLNVVMFLIIYTNKNCLSSFELGLDLIINVIVLLAIFLIAEKTKAYNVQASYAAFVVGAIQIARIFWIPLKYLNMNKEAVAKALEEGKDLSVLSFPGMSQNDFTWCVILLIASAVSLIAAGIIAILKNKILQQHLKDLQESR